MGSISKPILYYTILSPPARSVCFLAKAIGLEWEHRYIDIGKLDHLDPEFVKMNPQHTIPLLSDNGTIVWDSHAIMAYLISKYAKDDRYYPKDIKLRALVDQRLHFDSGMAFAALRRLMKSMIIHNENSLTERMLEDLDEVYDFVEAFLEGNKWICGEQVTIADFSLIATISSLNVIEPIDSRYKNIFRWLDQAKEWPFYHEVNVDGLERFKRMAHIFIRRTQKNSKL